MHTPRPHLLFSLAAVGLGLLTLLLAASSPSPAEMAGPSGAASGLAIAFSGDEPSAIRAGAIITGTEDGSPSPSLQSDVVGEVADWVLETVPASSSCAEPIVQVGSIITGSSPTFVGRLNRNAVPSLCGVDYTCPGTLFPSASFSYQVFNFVNTSDAWQCVHVTLDTRSCAQQVYSAAYLGSFDPAAKCDNIQGAMGYSTAIVYGYSFGVPADTDFVIVNNTMGVAPPSSDCASYVMTTTLCTADLAVAVTKSPRSSLVLSDSTGRATLPVDVVFENTGSYTAAVSADTVMEAVHISVRDGGPAAVQATFGHAGAIVPADGQITQTIPLAFSGSQYQCLPRTYQVTSQLEMTAGIYDCSGFNPPSSEVYAGSVLADATFDEDAVAFQSLPGTIITASVDTVSLATAFDIEACISGTPQGPCLPGLAGDDDVDCTFPPPAFGCPRFGGTLPADPDGDNIYYLRVGSGSFASNFAGAVGEYSALLLTVSGPTGACPVVPVLDNVVDSFSPIYAMPQSSLAVVPSPMTTIQATVLPINIRVPPADPGSPQCGTVLAPLIAK